MPRGVFTDVPATKHPPPPPKPHSWQLDSAPQPEGLQVRVHNLPLSPFTVQLPQLPRFQLEGQLQFWQVAVQVVPLGGSHCSPASTIPLPQTAGGVQEASATHRLSFLQPLGSQLRVCCLGVAPEQPPVLQPALTQLVQSQQALKWQSPLQHWLFWIQLPPFEVQLGAWQVPPTQRLGEVQEPQLTLQVVPQLSVPSWDPQKAPSEPLPGQVPPRTMQEPQPATQTLLAAQIPLQQSPLGGQAAPVFLQHTPP